MAFLKALFAVLALLVAGPALAANCAPYPYTLLNGTTADANLVMADFNSILNCANNNLAKNGANSDITSLSGLTTPLSTAQGGTGGTFTPANRAGDTFTGEVVTVATNVTNAGLNLPHGTAPAAPVNGDLWTTTGGAYARINGSTQKLAYSSGLFHIQHQQPNGGNSAGDAPGGAVWTTRFLNTSVVNTISGASLAANQFTLPAGTYRISAYAPTLIQYSFASIRLRLQDITAGTTVLQGANMTGYYTSPAAASPTNLQTALTPTLQGVFTLSAAHVLAIQTYQMAAGVGAVPAVNYTAISTGDVEVFNDVLLEKIG